MCGLGFHTGPKVAQSRHPARSDQRPLWAVISTGRCNTSAKSLCRRLEDPERTSAGRDQTRVSVLSVDGSKVEDTPRPTWSAVLHDDEAPDCSTTSDCPCRRRSTASRSEAGNSLRACYSDHRHGSGHGLPPLRARGRHRHFDSIARRRAQGELAIGGATPAATVRFIPRHHLRLESLLRAGQNNTRVLIVERNELTAALVSKSGR